MKRSERTGQQFQMCAFQTSNKKLLMNISFKHISISESGQKLVQKTKTLAKYVGRFLFLELIRSQLSEIQGRKKKKKRPKNPGKTQSLEELKRPKSLAKNSSFSKKNKMDCNWQKKNNKSSMCPDLPKSSYNKKLWKSKIKIKRVPKKKKRKELRKSKNKKFRKNPFKLHSQNLLTTATTK